MPVSPERVSVQVLGPFGASLGQCPVTPSAAKQRQILALLALNAGRVVTTATLAEELWGDAPPRSSATTLQTYVLHVRNRLAAAGPGGNKIRVDFLSTRHSGYLLEAGSCQTDVAEFERLARLGRRAAESNDLWAASDLLGQALALWRGQALDDVPVGRVLGLDATSLEAARLGVLERRIQADLALCRHADLVGELTLLAAENPLNENFCGLLMTALYRSGHPGGALQAFRGLRAAFNSELGLDPSTRLQQLHQAILAGAALEPALIPAAADPGPLARP